MSNSEIDKRYTIGDDEELLRLLSFPSCFKKNGKLATEAFSLYREKETYVSLNRLCYSSYEEAITLGGKIKVWKTKEDEFCGYAQLNAKRIRDVSLTHIRLDSKYRENFKGHAGISYICDTGKPYVNHKGSVEPEWILLLQQKLCKISKVVRTK